MPTSPLRRTLAALSLAALAATLVTACDADPTAVASAGSARPTSGEASPSASATVAAYVPDLAPGQVTALVPLLGVADSSPPNGYALAAHPDGMGLAMVDGVPTLLVAHELASTLGGIRAHGQAGGFVSAWTLDPREPAIAAGRDLLTAVAYWDYSAETWTGVPAPEPGGARPDLAPLSNLCSAFLTEPGQLFDEASRTGYAGQLFLVNEEIDIEGRVFAVTLDGGAFQVPSVGLFAHENSVIASGTGRRTVAVSTEDTSDGQLRVYVGEKASAGNPVQRAGLAGGALSVLAGPAGVATERAFRDEYGAGVAVAVSLSSPQDAAASGRAQNDAAAAAGLTFSRIEDAAFDPANPNALYFVTTIGGGTSADPALPGSTRDGGGLWRLDFADVARPEAGGTLTLVLDGTETPSLDGPDNIAFDARGNLLIQEDPTSAPHFRRIVAYRIADGALAVVSHVPLTPGDPVDALGGSTPGASYESSGIIDASAAYGAGWFLFDIQVHSEPEGGYLYAMYVADWDAVYAGGRK